MVKFLTQLRDPQGCRGRDQQRGGLQAGHPLPCQLSQVKAELLRDQKDTIGLPDDLGLVLEANIGDGLASLNELANLGVWLPSQRDRGVAARQVWASPQERAGDGVLRR